MAAGIHALAVPGLADGFAAVLGAHRFFKNDTVTLPRLLEPLQLVAQQWRRQTPDAWALVVHDWSTLKYPHHARKTDQTRLSHRKDRGYELTTLLLLDGRNGDPVAPLELRLRAARHVHSTRQPAPSRRTYRIDAVQPSMQAVADLKLGEALVHVIDREADALAQYRDWQAAGHHFLVRAKGGRKVRWRDREQSLAQIAEQLPLRRCREVTYRGQTAVQRVAETVVVLDRPAWRHRRRGGVVNERVPGPPLTLRLVVSRVCDASGRTLAVWYLLTNLPATVNTATVALWYYWRWRIESLFRLLKSGGHQVEHWQQCSGEAIAKRLLVAAMACTLVWRLAGKPSAEAETLRGLLIRLSGRQMKYGQRHTHPALLAGLWVLLALLETLQEHSVEELRRFKQILLADFEEDSG